MNEQPFRSLDIQLEVPIAASPEKVWKALTEKIGAWWPKHFYISEKPKGFVLEKKVGGRVYEDWGGGHGLLWGTIVVLEEGKKLQWAGDLAAEFGGPGRTLTSYTVQPQGEGTLLQFRDTPFGHLSPTTGASLTEGWKDLLENCFKAYVEQGQQRFKLKSVD